MSAKQRQWDYIEMAREKEGKKKKDARRLRGLAAPYFVIGGALFFTLQ
jgi:hypothetical protein